MDRKFIIDQIKEQILSKGTLELRLLFVDFKLADGSQNEAIEIMLELMEIYKDDELKHDAVLDLADYVYGFCIPGNKIW